MLLKILGWFWVITGVIFLLKPEKLRNKLKKQSLSRLKRIFFAAGLFLGILLIKATWGVPGILAIIILCCGFIAIFKAIFFLKSQTADRVIDWWLNQPIKYFRIWAVAQIIFGAILLSI